MLTGIFLSFFVFKSAENVSQIFNTEVLMCTKNESVEKWVEFGREESYSIKLNYWCETRYREGLVLCILLSVNISEYKLHTIHVENLWPYHITLQVGM